MDIGQLVTCLAGSLDSDVDVQKAAESRLESVKNTPGYGVALVKVVLAKEIPEGTRHLAAVLLKQDVKRHWQDEAPFVNDADKRTIRELLAQALSDPSSKLRTAVGVAIATIAGFDWPENWPHLLGVLTTAIKERKDPNLVQGALRCLSMFASDIDDQQLATVLPVLLPELRIIASLGGNDEEQMKRRSISIVYGFLQSLAVMSGIYPQETQALIEPHVGSWMEVFLSILTAPITLKDMDHWGVVIETVKCTIQFLVNFPKLMSSYTELIMKSACSLLLSSFPMFSSEIISQEVEDAEFDSDGDNTDLQTLVSQIFELVQTLIGKRYACAFKSSVPDLMYLTIGYMQMTETQVGTWMSDPNQYLASESEELFTARVSGEVLINAMVETYEGDGITALMGAIERHMQESFVAKSQGKSDWWKCREAAIACIGHISDSFGEFDGDGSHPKFNAAGILDTLFKNDVDVTDPCPYLVGRVLSIVGQMANFVSTSQAEGFVRAAVIGLKSPNPPPVKIGSCMVVSNLCPLLSSDRLKTMLPDIYESMKHLMEECTEEMLNLVLETLTQIIKVDKETAPKFEPYLTPLVLKTWSENMNDPLFGPPAMAAIEAFSENEACLGSLCGSMLPTLSAAISSHKTQEASVVEGSLDLITILLKGRHPEVAKMVYMAIAPALVDLLTTSDDHGILQSGTQLLQAVVRVGGEGMLSWGNADPQTTLGIILNIIRRILAPDMDDAPALHIGQVVNCLLQYMPVAFASCLPQLIEMLVTKLNQVNMSPVMISLLLVFCRMVHANARELVDVLSGMSVRQKDGSVASGLQVVMSIWAERSLEISGAFNIRLSVTALAVLLKSGHPKLNDIQVRGKMVSLESGVRTRSKSRADPERWTIIPLPVKIFLVLVDTLMESEGASEEFVDDIDEEGRVHEWDRPLQYLNGKMVSAGDYLSRCAAIAPTMDDEPDDPNDPIAKIDLMEFITSELKSIAAADRSFFQTCTEHLNPMQLQIVQEACQ
ncbi:hypothetical protein BSKO_02339 [Bryopsis sp. KO-2023]|nr:hypothetical protein BSKO_02339 [Bryopsis sp. KO-2023]